MISRPFAPSLLKNSRKESIANRGAVLKKRSAGQRPSQVTAYGRRSRGFPEQREAVPDRWLCDGRASDLARHGPLLIEPTQGLRLADLLGTATVKGPHRFPFGLACFPSCRRVSRIVRPRR